MSKSSKKAVPPKGKSPGVPKDAKSTNKYSTDGAGRATPSGFGKKHTKPGNP